MSVVVWDGSVLAADRQGTNADLKIQCTKIIKLPCGAIAAWTGTHEQGLVLARWYEQGAKVEDWPEFQKTDEWTRLVVADGGYISVFEKQPIPQPCEEAKTAWGSGRDFAIGAMERGASATEAVVVASKYCASCGGGVDFYRIK